MVSSTFATSSQLARIVGRWVWFCLLNRPLLAVYQFTSANHVRQVKLPDEAVAELTLMIKLVPFLVVNLRAPVSPIVMASDASLHGAGVTKTHSAKSLLLLPFSLRKGWWSSMIPQPDESLNRLVFPDVLDKFVREHSWETVICHRFHFADNIVILEGQACLLAVRWFLSASNRHGCRVAFFIDSQALLGALVKGRSSSNRLNNVCRKITAHVLAGGLRMSWLWIPSDKNPADAPSRQFTPRNDK